ncbi:GTP cyclohydrolase II [Hyalangium rubrum]|uniref:GTP cyclohydrolase-2 n=1 Tax=Hyalangium rubrum TaxID=3103134 RepID=A0ABU5H476_9BACT|nr:GTP cyclohydrolase II [Hyalangium sp. s54d21]MDY7228150.1 GTP cyclohydrolase II [Hyalangium sp. s54d21]
MLNQPRYISEALDSKPVVTVRRDVPIPILDGYSRGVFYTFHNLPDGKEHFVVQLGPEVPGRVPLVRLHSECMTGDVFGSQRCDCGAQLREALFRINSEGGYLVYLRQEGRGIGLYAKMDAYHLQTQGMDTFEANRHLNFEDDLRSYSCAADMLAALDVRRIRLLSNNPDKAEQLTAHGISIVEQVSTGIYLTAHNERYLEAKVTRANHNLKLR